jgi:hypothetical protein
MRLCKLKNGVKPTKSANAKPSEICPGDASPLSSLRNLASKLNMKTSLPLLVK